MVRTGMIDYHFFYGYGSDIGALSAWGSAYALFMKDATPKEIFLYSGGFYTAYEFAQIFMDSFTFDPMDIPAYWLGAGIALGVNKMFPKDNLESRL